MKRSEMVALVDIKERASRLPSEDDGRAPAG